MLARSTSNLTPKKGALSSVEQSSVEQSGVERNRLASWHTMTRAEIARELDCKLTGLGELEAKERLTRFGENRLPETPPVSEWIIFFRQFHNPLIYILVLAALVSLSLGLLDDAVFILIVLMINATIGFIQESRAEKEISSLGKILGSQARVQRDGHIREVDTTSLVPADVVWLEAGMHVPADIRLLASYGLRIDQSLLTGESVPVEKFALERMEENVDTSDQSNMVFSGSSVIQGRGNGIVVGTGTNSQVGLIALELHEEGAVKPPLVIRMERFTKVVAAAVLGLSMVVFAIGIARGTDWSEMFMAAVALSVSAIPEGLPVALTVALAIGIKRMAKRKVLVRRLEAVEALGSCSVIGSDKTGTLTTNQLTIVAGRVGEKPFSVSGAGYGVEGVIRVDDAQYFADTSPSLSRLTRAAILCNNATLVAEDSQYLLNGDPMDLALLALAYKAGHDPGDINSHYPRTNEIPFESERRFSASFHRDARGRGLTIVKGAPERVIPMCEFVSSFQDTGVKTIDSEEMNGWVESLTLEGYRVLALADAETETVVPAKETPQEPQGLTLLGLVGMTDPPREAVPKAIQACCTAGIKVMMITGDHLHTACTIADQIGLDIQGQKVLDGPTLNQMSDEALAQGVENLSVVGRANPADKLRVVKALRDRGRFVAVTGDGVNDAPALKAANIGVAMGKGGTDVAREASDLVITDDNFATIIAGIEEGRVTFDNVRKVIFLLVSTGLGEVLAVLLAILSGLPVPFLPAQLLWLNLVTNGVQDVALAFEPGEPGVLERPPRPETEGIFNRIMVERTVLSALVFGLVSFLMFRWLMQAGYGVDESRAMVLNLFVVFEIMQLGNARSESRSLFLSNPFSNPFLLLGTIVAVTLHLIALTVPATQQILGATIPSLETWSILILLASSIIFVMELHKLYRNFRPLT